MKYRLTIYPDIDSNKTKYKKFLFKTTEELLAAKNTSADLLLFVQDDLKIMKDSSNLFIQEQFINGVWEEMEEEDY